MTLDFFDDIWIPSYLMQQPSEFDSRTSLWVWKYSIEEGGDGDEFSMNIGEQVSPLFN